MNKKINIPNRRKSKDNPYTLDYISNTDNYVVIFKNSEGKVVKVNISAEVYNALDKFELEDISQLHEFERHIEHSEIYENNLNQRAFTKQKSVEDIVEENIINENIRHAISDLSDIQKRRIIKYYFDGKNEYEIAKEEGTTHQSVHTSLERAKDKLKEILKNYKF